MAIRRSKRTFHCSRIRTTPKSLFKIRLWTLQGPPSEFARVGTRDVRWNRRNCQDP